MGNYQPTRTPSPTQRLFDERRRSMRRDPVRAAQVDDDAIPPLDTPIGKPLSSMVGTITKRIDNDPYRLMLQWVNEHWHKIGACLPSEIAREITLVRVDKLPGDKGQLVISIGPAPVQYKFRHHQRALEASLTGMTRGKISSVLVTPGGGK